jgi:hypothetical protein
MCCNDTALSTFPDLFRFARRYLKQNRLLTMHERLVHPKVSSPVELNDIILLQSRHILICQCLCNKLCLRVQEVLEVVAFLELVLCNQKVKVRKLNWDKLLVR